MSYRYSKAKIEWFIKKIWYNECEITTARSSWPGGQNVNKRETKVQLIRNIHESTTLPKHQKERFIELQQNNISEEWNLRVDAEVHRTQKANKELLMKKLSQMIHAAFKPPKAPRKVLPPPKHVVDKRIAEKKKKSKIRARRTKIL